MLVFRSIYEVRKTVKNVCEFEVLLYTRAGCKKSCKAHNEILAR
jgi:hypothetical protein